MGRAYARYTKSSLYELKLPPQRKIVSGFTSVVTRLDAIVLGYLMPNTRPEGAISSIRALLTLRI